MWQRFGSWRDDGLGRGLAEAAIQFARTADCANAGRVGRDVLLATLRMTLWGIGAGLAASLVVTRLIGSLLFGTSPWDLPTYAATVGVFLAVALISGYLPARKASRVDPMIALRSS